MNEPQDPSSGDSTAIGSRLGDRLAERASGKSGVVDTKHARELYGRTAGWIADRFPLLAHVKSRYDAGDEGYQQGQPLVMRRALSTTAEAAPEFAQTVPSSARISRKGEDSVSQSQSPGSSASPPVTYRVSRRPSYQALTIDRATPGGDSLARSTRVEPNDSIKESGPQPKLAPDADMSALRVALPITAGDREPENPIGRPEANTVKTGTANSSGNDYSGGSAGSTPGASLRIASETPSLAHKGEMILLKRDNAFSAQPRNREAPPAGVTEMSSTRAVDGTREPRELAANREPPTGVAPIASELGESVSPPTFGHQSASGNVVAITLNRQQAAPESPLILRQPKVGKTNATKAPLPGEGNNRDLAAASEDSGMSRALNPGDGTGVMRSGAEAGQPAGVPSGAPGFVAETIYPAVLEPRAGLPAPRLAGEAISREALSSASSAASTHAAASTPSLPLVEPQTSHAVQRKRLELNRAAVPGLGTNLGSLIAREIRAAPHQPETPNIVWRHSVSAARVGGSPAPDTTMMLSASRSNFATSAEDSSSSGSPYNSQPAAPLLPESNQSPSIDLGRITEQIVRAIQRRLEVERERRGMGR
jgi:hypothetical protein